MRKRSKIAKDLLKNGTKRVLPRGKHAKPNFTHHRKYRLPVEAYLQVKEINLKVRDGAANLRVRDLGDENRC